LEQNNVRTAALQKHFEENAAGDADRSKKVKDIMHVLANVQRGLQATDTDVAKLTESLEQNDAATHALQQGHASLSQSLSNLTRAHEKEVADITSLQKDLAKAKQGLSDTQDGLSKTTNLANNLHNGLHKTNDNLQKTALQLDGLDLKHNSLQDTVDKTCGAVGNLMKGHRKAVSNVQGLQHELEKTNETLTTARNHLEETKMDLHDVKGNLSRTNDTMQKLDLGVEFQHACFAGLRKGFQDTQITTKPTMLPKLTQGNGDLKASQSILGPKTKFTLVSNALPDSSGAPHTAR
jgi:chromosome segregation ATPase